MTVWISPARTSVGHAVRLTRGAAELIGWVNFERDLMGPWRAWCSSSRCHELGSAYTREKAAGIIEQHYLIEHR